jgi:acetoin utilization deacetylase AcuC-like enzyme
MIKKELENAGHKIWTEPSNLSLDSIARAVETSEIVFVIQRAPGHHAGHDYFSGYCFYNNGFYASSLLKSKYNKISILDIDYHAGDGTYDIYKYMKDSNIEPWFYPISINIDPANDYPHYVGFNDDEHFLTFSPKCSIDNYLALLEKAKDIIKKNNTDCLIIAFGADTYMDDPENVPESRTQIKVSDFELIGRSIKELNLPTMVLQEGGYNMNEIGNITFNFMNGLIN